MAVQYCLLTAPTPEQLEGMVQGKLAAGWVCQGGISVTMALLRGGKDGKQIIETRVYAQALVQT